MDQLIMANVFRQLHLPANRRPATHPDTRNYSNLWQVLRYMQPHLQHFIEALHDRPQDFDYVAGVMGAKRLSPHPTVYTFQHDWQMCPCRTGHLAYDRPTNAFSKQGEAGKRFGDTRLATVPKAGS